VVVDVHRGHGPPAAKNYTFAALITTDATIARAPDDVGAAVRGIVAAHRALRADPSRAAEVGARRFPPAAASMIAGLVERDLPFYDAVVHEDAVRATQEFARALGRLDTASPYEDVVAVRYRDLWTPGGPG